MRMSENSSEIKWVEQIKEYRKQIAALKTKDRLETTASISKLHVSIAASLSGWLQWLKNPAIMNQLTHEELLETFKVFKKLAEEFLELDLKITRAVYRKQKKKGPKRRKKKDAYIA